MPPIAQAHKHVVFGAHPHQKESEDIARAQGASKENFGDIVVKSGVKSKTIAIQILALLPKFVHGRDAA